MTTTLSVLGADVSGESNLTYSWSTIGNVPGSRHLQRQRNERRQKYYGHVYTNRFLYLSRWSSWTP